MPYLAVKLGAEPESSLDWMHGSGDEAPRRPDHRGDGGGFHLRGEDRYAEQCVDLQAASRRVDGHVERMIYRESLYAGLKSAGQQAV
jgi:hypothetical protein